MLILTSIFKCYQETLLDNMVVVELCSEIVSVRFVVIRLSQQLRLWRDGQSTEPRFVLGKLGAQQLIGRMLDSRPRSRGFEFTTSLRCVL